MVAPIAGIALRLKSYSKSPLGKRMMNARAEIGRTFQVSWRCHAQQSQRAKHWKRGSYVRGTRLTLLDKSRPPNSELELRR